MHPDNISLIGFMGTGKSSVAKALKAHYPYFKVADCDSLIVDRSGKSIADIFAEDGEDIFRSLESVAIHDILSQEKTIVATGGGAILREANRQILKDRSWVIWLSASPEVIYDRIKNESHRPLLGTGSASDEIIEQIRTLLHQRFNAYREITDVMINTNGLTPDQVAEAIHEELERLIQCSKSV
jgi:shikimate kinase